jgi:hypothetical protein
LIVFLQIPNTTILYHRQFKNIKFISSTSSAGPYLRGGAHAQGHQVSGVAKYFSKINFKNDVPNEKKKKIVCFIML